MSTGGRPRSWVSMSTASRWGVASSCTWRGTRRAHPVSRKWRCRVPAIVGAAKARNGVCRPGSKRRSAIMSASCETWTRSSTGSPCGSGGGRSQWRNRCSGGRGGRGPRLASVGVGDVDAPIVGIDGGAGERATTQRRGGSSGGRVTVARGAISGGVQPLDGGATAVRRRVGACSLCAWPGFLPRSHGSTPPNGVERRATAVGVRGVRRRRKGADERDDDPERADDDVTLTGRDGR